MAHMQFQFQTIYKKYNLQLHKCPTCCDFAQVDYYPGKSITIYHGCQLHVLMMEKADYPKLNEEEFVVKAVTAWNRGEYDH